MSILSDWQWENSPRVKEVREAHELGKRMLSAAVQLQKDSAEAYAEGREGGDPWSVGADLSHYSRLIMDRYFGCEQKLREHGQ